MAEFISLERFRSLAEFSRIPVVVTNQVRSLSGGETPQYSFQGIITEQLQVKDIFILEKLAIYVVISYAGQKASKDLEYPASDSHLVAALGIHWAHAVSVRLVFESRSGFLVHHITENFYNFSCIT